MYSRLLMIKKMKVEINIFSVVSLNDEKVVYCCNDKCAIHFNFVSSLAKCSNNCQNGGTCNGRQNCVCPTDFMGRFCDIRKSQSSLELEILFR